MLTKMAFHAWLYVLIEVCLTASDIRASKQFSALLIRYSFLFIHLFSSGTPLLLEKCPDFLKITKFYIGL